MFNLTLSIGSALSTFNTNAEKQLALMEHITALKKIVGAEPTIESNRRLLRGLQGAMPPVPSSHNPSHA